jgi:hypothetical protein
MKPRGPRSAIFPARGPSGAPQIAVLRRLFPLGTGLRCIERFSPRRARAAPRPSPQQTRRQAQNEQLPGPPQSRPAASAYRHRKSHQNPRTGSPPLTHGAPAPFEPPNPSKSRVTTRKSRMNPTDQQTPGRRSLRPIRTRKRYAKPTEASRIRQFSLNERYWA